MKRLLLTVTTLSFFLWLCFPSTTTNANGMHNPLRRYPILQFFATNWRDIQKRLPEIVQAGYGALWLPPPEKAGTGRNSVGYDPADRFDLGDRFQYGSVVTQYGSTHDLIELINEAHRLGLEVYFDTVANHNANRVAVKPDGYPDLIPQDFHIKSVSALNNDEMTDFTRFSFQIWNNDLLGLEDLAQEDGNMVLPVGSPLPPGVSLNAAGKPSFIRHPFTSQYYLTGARGGEDVREFLNRWGKWLGNTIGADGFRLDAVKHIPPPFWGGARSFTSPTDGRTYKVSAPPFLNELQSGVAQRSGHNAYTFGEALSGDGIELGVYAQTGMLLLDFPLRFNFANVYNSNGFGDIGATFSNPPSVFGIGFEYGGIDRNVGVTFVHSHDDPAPTSNNLATAHVLTRVGRPIVYFDGNNIADGSNGFPKPGRSDALGEGSKLTTSLVEVHNKFARGDMISRFSSNDLFVFERIVDGNGVMLVGLNDRGDRAEFGTQTANVQTAFAAGTVLIDYSGQMPPLTVDSNGRVTISVPTNNDPTNDPPNPPPPGVFCNGDTCFENNGRGFVLYAPATPQAPVGGTPIVIEENGVSLPLQNFPTVDGRFNDPQPNTTFAAPVVTTNKITLKVSTDATAASAAIRLDDGAPINNRTPLTNTPENLSDGFVIADKQSPGNFTINDIDISNLAEGLHVVRALVFTNTVANKPPLFSTFTQVFFVNRPSKNRITIDGTIIDDFRPLPVAKQLVAASEGDKGVNELKAMFVEHDEKNLYIGLSSRINGAESANSLNGIVLFIDTDFGRRTGLTNFDLLNDDSGPATRLLSNSRVEAPLGFGAEIAIASFRGGGLNIAPVAPFVSDFAIAPPVGARAGVYRIDTAKPDDLMELPGFIGFNSANIAQRATAADEEESPRVPDNGFEVAIHLDDLFPNFDGDGLAGNDNNDGGFPITAILGLVAYITSTGETGQVTGAANQLGGRAPAIGFVKNQFLPTHPQFRNPPGQQPIRLTHAAIVTKFR
ncbi:MAG: alpha-amylase family glycosyl hydrolase [Acidobacteriota bacterium]